MLLIAIGMLLIGLEFLIKGRYIVWFGLGALFAGLIAFFMGEPEWPVQAALFCFCVMMSVAVGRRMRKDTPGLTAAQRSAQQKYMGRQAYLQIPIVNGEGKIKLDDKFYTVRGPDLPKGTIVEIVAVDKTAFTVAKAYSNLE
ncbi:NfeD family protein [Desulfovibrio sp. OttesenSCG-928-C06]|nr:NfeD family protein [Desulfovibrio sp. OttesenSCG-928-C06]